MCVQARDVRGRWVSVSVSAWEILFAGWMGHYVQRLDEGFADSCDLFDGFCLGLFARGLRFHLHSHTSPKAWTGSATTMELTLNTPLRKLQRELAYDGSRQDGIMISKSAAGPLLLVLIGSCGLAEQHLVVGRIALLQTRACTRWRIRAGLMYRTLTHPIVLGQLWANGFCFSECADPIVSEYCVRT